MHLDAAELQDFYDGELGQISRRFIRSRLREVWPNVRGLSVLGVGYATPYLRPFQAEAARVIALMPAQQGVAAWPSQSANVTALTNEGQLPLPDACIDRAIIVHVVETSEELRPLLRQIWRVLTPSGRIVVVAPNRTSLWAQFETTPFGHGRPFSRSQLSRLLVDAMFTPTASTTCLHMPPFGARWLVRSGTRWERWGQKMWPQLAGVHLTEATKEVMALAPDKGSRARVRKPVLVTKPAGSTRRSRPRP
ncbi:MAG: methyltransferase domain-containing protein [Alphaproteobacteria bacterium]|nr:methyltransferase domain-containing protein [Alphaproteobacteria bacterium]